MTMETVKTLSDEELFRTLDSYPWGSDEEYQHGLQAILGPNPSEEQARHLTLRSRCFYYSRKFNVPVDFAAYQEWHNNNQPNGVDSSLTGSRTTDLAQTDTEEKPPYPMTFNEIVELITTGKPVPGVKDIPNTVLEGRASESTSSGRRKPWES